jgi:hypothetical protein
LVTYSGRTWLAWAWTALLLVLCLMPKSWFPRKQESSRKIPHLDKVVHFGLFGMFAALWAYPGPRRFASASASRPATRRTRVIAAALALAVGTELAQGLPAIDRDPDPLDALADVAGAFAGVGLIAVRPRTVPGDDLAPDGG